MNCIFNLAVLNNDNVSSELLRTTSLDEYCTLTSHIVHESGKNHNKNMSSLKHKRYKRTYNQTSSKVLSHQLNTDIESNDSENQSPANSEHHTHTNQFSAHETPTFVGRRIIENDKKSKNKSPDLSSSTINQLLALTTKFETQYLKPLLVGQERIEGMTKCLFANQKKIQNILRKQKVIDNLLCDSCCTCLS